LRRELLQWFKERVPGFADGYDAAVRLVHEAPFPARAHLVCHVVRDIYRELPTALGDTSQKQAGSSVYPPLVAALRDVWDMNPVLDGGVPSDSDRPVSARAHSAAARLVETSRTLKEQGSVGTRLARALFRAVDRPEQPVPGWIFKAFDKEYDFFVARAHLRGSTVPWGDDIRTHFESFEGAFHSIVGSYFKGKGDLDAILADTNRRAD
jgi:hypothetical protein